MAYATVAGLPVSVGLYTAFVPMVIYALLGSSRVLSVSSTTTLAILVGAQLGAVVPDGDPTGLITATATLTALTGVLLLLASALRLGFVANFISTPVLTGFKAGIGLVVVLDQVPKFLGIHIDKRGFFHDLLSIARDLPHGSGTVVVIAALSVIALLALEKIRPHSAAPLIVIGTAILLSWLLGLAAMGVATVGTIPQALPSLTLPSLDLVQRLLPGAFGIAAHELYRDNRRRAGLRASRRPNHQGQS
jgi:SulP family sulfate permease